MNLPGIALTGDATNKKITISSSSSKNFSVTEKTFNYTFTTSSTKFIYIGSSGYNDVTQHTLVGSNSWTNSSGILALAPSYSFVHYYKGYCVSLGSISSLRNKIIKLYIHQSVDANADQDNYLSTEFILSGSNIMYGKTTFIRFYNNVNVDVAHIYEYNNIDVISYGTFTSYNPCIFTNGSNLYYGTYYSSLFSAPSNTGGTPDISVFNPPTGNQSSSWTYSFNIKCWIMDW